MMKNHLSDKYVLPFYRVAYPIILSAKSEAKSISIPINEGTVISKAVLYNLAKTHPDDTDIVIANLSTSNEADSFNYLTDIPFKDLGSFINTPTSDLWTQIDKHIKSKTDLNILFSRQAVNLDSKNKSTPIHLSLIIEYYDSRK